MMKPKQLFGDDDKILLLRLINTNKKPGRGFGALTKYWKALTYQFNKETLNGKKHTKQLRNFYNNERRRYNTFPDVTPIHRRNKKAAKQIARRERANSLVDLGNSDEIICRNIRCKNSYVCFVCKRRHWKRFTTRNVEDCF